MVPPYLYRSHGQGRSLLHSLADSGLGEESGDGRRLYSEQLQVQSSWHRMSDKLGRREKHSRLQAPQ